MRIRHVLVLVVAMAPALAGAQFRPNGGPPVDPNTRFDAVVIRPIEQAAEGLLMRSTPGGFESSLPIAVLVRMALQKPDYQIDGAPRWLETERYAIKAKPPAGVTPAATPVLIANLLKDRFQLQTHLETREQPVFHLVMARADGRLGPDLRPTSAECQARIKELQETLARGGPLPSLPTSLPGPNDPLPCGFVRSPPGVFAGSGRNISQEMTRALSDLTGRVVIDKTGLSGLYDFALKFAYEGRQPLGPLGSLGPQGPALTAQGDPNAPSLSIALQEQLGLKLEGARGQVEVAVIDRIEKPAVD